MSADALEPDIATVFVVEDDAATRRLLEGLLELGGFQVRSFEKAEDFLEAYDFSGNGCLLLDVHLPGMSGLELQDELCERQCDIPIIVMSAMANVPMAVQALKFGAIDFLEKPVSRDALLGRVRQVLQSKGGGAGTPELIGAPRARLASLDSERRRLEARLEEVERGLVKSRDKERAMSEQVDALMQTSARLTTERENLQTQLEDARQRQTEVSSARTAESQERLKILESQLSALNEALAMTRAVAAEEVEQAQSESQREIETLRAQLGRAVQSADVLRDELDKSHEELELREQQTDEGAADQAESEEELARLSGEHASLEARLQTVEAEAERLRALRTDEESRAASLDQQLREALAAIDQLQSDRSEEKQRTMSLAQELQQAEEEIDRLQAIRKQEEQRIAELDRQLQEAVTAREVLAEEQEQQAAEPATSSELVNEMSARLEEAVSARQALEAALAQERSGRAAEVAELSEQLVQLRTDLASQLAELTGRFREVPAATERDAAVHESFGALSMPIPSASNVLEADPTSAPEVEGPARTAEDTRSILILDDGPLAQALSHALERLRYEPVVVGNAGMAAESARLGPLVTVVNLSSPGSWRSVCEARSGASGRVAPLIGCIHDPQAASGLFLGQIEFAQLPTDIDELAVIGKRIAPKAKTIILLGGDIDRMGEVRERLRGSNISTALVFDGRQLVDLVPIVRPGTALLHVSPGCPDVFRAIWTLRTRPECVEIPLVFLLDSEPPPDESAFMTRELTGFARRGSHDVPRMVSEVLRMVQRIAALSNL